MEALARDLGWGAWLDAPVADPAEERRADLAAKAALVNALGGER